VVAGWLYADEVQQALNEVLTVPEEGVVVACREFAVHATERVLTKAGRGGERGWWVLNLRMR
jgi:hypothetical protein